MEAKLFESIRVGFSGWGDLVLYCELCGDTFAKELQNKTLKEVNDLAEAHECVVE